MRITIATLCVLFYALTANAQNLPLLQAQKSFGGTNLEEANSIQQTKDGGYIVAGYSRSNNGNVSGHHGAARYSDYWIIKISPIGSIQWQKSLGGTSYDEAKSIQQTKDGGYIVAGYSWSNDGDVSGHHGDSFYQDYWIVKLDSNGNIQWQKSLGGIYPDEARSIQQTKDGGYIIAGYSQSYDGDVSGNHGGGDFWIVKLAASGNIQWQKCLGGTEEDDGNSIQQTTDGGYIVAGSSASYDDDVTSHHGGTSYNYDYWIVKLDATGNIQWQKSLGGTYDEVANSIQQTADGGYIIAGFSSSNDDDVNGHHGTSDYFDYWIVKLDAIGNIQWQKSFGGTYDEAANSIQQTKDGGYIIAGFSYSNDRDVSGHHGYLDYDDYWIVKLDATGNIQWQKSLGGSGYDMAQSIQQTKDGGYIVAGFSSSNDGDVNGHHGTSFNYDYWIVKLSATGNFISQLGVAAPTEKNIKASVLCIQPNPVHSVLHVEGLSLIKNYELRIMNESGLVVQQASIKNISSYDIDVSKLAKGIYFLQAGAERVKFVKE